MWAIKHALCNFERYGIFSPLRSTSRRKAGQSEAYQTFSLPNLCQIDSDKGAVMPCEVSKTLKEYGLT